MAFSLPFTRIDKCVVFNSSRTKSEAIFVNVLVIFMQYFCLKVLCFCSRIFGCFLSDCLHFSSSFLSDLSCSRSEIKFVGKSGCERKAIRSNVAEWWRCHTANVEVSGSNLCGLVFCYPKTLLSYIKLPSPDFREQFIRHWSVYVSLFNFNNRGPFQNLSMFLRTGRKKPVSMLTALLKL